MSFVEIANFISDNAKVAEGAVATIIVGFTAFRESRRIERDPRLLKAPKKSRRAQTPSPKA